MAPRKRNTDPPLVKAVKDELRQLEVDPRSVDALLAIELAGDLSSPDVQARATLTRELRAVMSGLRKGSVPDDGWDELVSGLAEPAS